MTELFRYTVTIEYEDGVIYKDTIHAENSTRAFSLGLRAAAPFGAFQAPVKSWDAVIDELEEQYYG